MLYSTQQQTHSSNLTHSEGLLWFKPTLAGGARSGLTPPPGLLVSVYPCRRSWIQSNSTLWTFGLNLLRWEKLDFSLNSTHVGGVRSGQTILSRLFFWLLLATNRSDYRLYTILFSRRTWFSSTVWLYRTWRMSREGKANNVQLYLLNFWLDSAHVEHAGSYLTTTLRTCGLTIWYLMPPM